MNDASSKSVGQRYRTTKLMAQAKHVSLDLPRHRFIISRRARGVRKATSISFSGPVGAPGYLRVKARAEKYGAALHACPADALRSFRFR